MPRRLLQCLLSLSGWKSSCRYGRNSQDSRSIGCIPEVSSLQPVPFELLCCWGTSVPLFKAHLQCCYCSSISGSACWLNQRQGSGSHVSTSCCNTVFAIPFLNILPTSSAATVPASDRCILFIYCYRSSIRSMYLLIQVLHPSQFLLTQAPRAVHAQACCSACYRYQCSTPFLLLRVVDWHRIIYWSSICWS